MMVRGCCQQLAASGGGGGAGRAVPSSGGRVLRSSSSSSSPRVLPPRPLAPYCGGVMPGGLMALRARACSTSGSATSTSAAGTTINPPPRRRASTLARRPPRSPTSVAAAASGSSNGALSSSSSKPRDTFTITTPLFYVNAAPHMGSAYPTIAADVIARYQRLRGRRVRFVTGTDEHGEKIALAAAAQGMEPQQHCDAVAAQYRALWEALDISYDAFVRTTDAAHEAVVRELLERAWSCERPDGGGGGANDSAAAPSSSSSSSSPVVYRAAYSGYYCVGCEEYKDESEMVAIPEGEHAAAGATCCPVHRAPCLERNEDNYFFALTKFQREIEALLTRGGGGVAAAAAAAAAGDGSPTDAAAEAEAEVEFVMPSARRNEVLGWVKEGLRDFSISRAKVKWGVPLPRDPSQTAYVWFDALAGYLTGTLAAAEVAQDGDATATATTTTTTLLDRLPAAGWPADVHVVGKDILRFHAVYWPGMLYAAGLDPPRRILGHGFLTKDGLKMGKSLGNTLDPAALTAAYGADAVRFWLVKEVALGSDGNFREAAFRDSVNAGLANTVGNLLNRTLGMLHKYYPGGVLPADSADPTLAPELRKLVETAVSEAAEAYERLAPHAAVEAVLAAAAGGNRFLEEAAPWTALKKGTDDEKREAGRALVAALEAARVLAAALYPVTPALAARVWRQLNAPGPMLQVVGGAAAGGGGGERPTWEGATRWGQLAEGHVTALPEPVFLRIDDTAPFVAEVAGVGGGGQEKKKEGGGGKQPKQQKQPKAKQQPKQEAKEEPAASAV